VGRDVNDSDVFVFNADFTDERARVHINQIQVKETVSLQLLSFHPMHADPYFIT
jgi:hypothetical protein